VRKLVCNTSPLQYLHQIGLLDIVPRLTTQVLVPKAVADDWPQDAGKAWIFLR